MSAVEKKKENQLPTSLPSFSDLFGPLSDECKEVVVEYSHNIRGFKDESFITFTVSTVNGCLTPTVFRDRLRELCRPGMAKLADIVLSSLEKSTSDYLQEIADDFAELSYYVYDDVQVFDENEYGSREEHSFKSFAKARFIGTIDDQITSFRQSILRKTSDFAETWLEVVADTKQKICFLVSQHEMAMLSASNKPSDFASAESYISQERINELRTIDTAKHDLTRLIRMCEELNEASACKLHYATAILVRAIIDHVPPIFGKITITDVSGSYGTRSFRDSMVHLDKSLRKIADSFLHTPIRKQEILPTKTQVNFSQDLDVLLAEICRVMKGCEKV